MLAKLKDLYSNSKAFRSFVYSAAGVGVAVLTHVSTAAGLSGPTGAIVGAAAAFAAAQLSNWLQAHPVEASAK